jgi:hypothetical protein
VGQGGAKGTGSRFSQGGWLAAVNDSLPLLAMLIDNIFQDGWVDGLFLTPSAK